MYKWIFNYKEMTTYNNETNYNYYHYSIACTNLNTKSILINLETINIEYPYVKNELIRQICIIMSHEVIHNTVKDATGSNFFSCQWDNIAYNLEEYL